MFKKLFRAVDKNGLDHVSWRKVGVTICSVAGAILSAGICPPAALPVAKAILAIGAGIGLVGAVDATKK